MNKDDIIRAWKDPHFRAQLTAEQLASLPESPAGLPLTGLEEGDLANAVGGKPKPLTTAEGACPTAFCRLPNSIDESCDFWR
jgi:mersacidin/lichenicidin family type 2 lantibiotic